MSEQRSLFHAAGANSPHHVPLAERMRPQAIDEVVGHDEITSPSSFLGRILHGATPRSCILWGPPGSGKTTFARLLAARSEFVLESMSAVLAGVKDVRAVIARARQRREHEGKGTIVFVDEIHRFHKGQQDAFLPHVENGTVVLVGATTENPSFEVTAPLLSRCRVVRLETLAPQAIEAILDRAMRDRDRGLGALGVELEADARAFLAERSGGDARAALNALEAAVDLAVSHRQRRITLALAEQGLQRRVLRYDKDGEEHFNVVSAFIKCMRDSHVDGALYWLARMIEAGEDPLFIARRMVIFASEDVGLADTHALPLAVAVKEAVHFVGMPEARVALAHGAAYLALAPKSNASYAALERAVAEVRRSGALAVPMNLRNATTDLMRRFGYGKGYVYAHGQEREAATQQHLPVELAGCRFFAAGHEPDQGAEAETPATDSEEMNEDQ